MNISLIFLRKYSYVTNFWKYFPLNKKVSQLYTSKVKNLGRNVTFFYKNKIDQTHSKRELYKRIEKELKFLHIYDLKSMFHIYRLYLEL